MKVRCLSLAWIVMLAGSVTASAQGLPELAPQSTHYRFLPRFSVLNETGGIFPRDIDYRVRGTFDFVTDPGPTDVWPGAGTAKFDNVDAWASHPILAYVLPLDEVLNLSGLEGRQVPVVAPLDVYEFEGEAFDSSVRLLAASIGPWLFLRGQTTPPTNGADFLEYRFHALARRTPYADFDANDWVNVQDLDAWRTLYGSSVSPGGADQEHLVDGADFLAWQRQLGESAPSSAELDGMLNAALSTISSAAAPVPEPASMLLAVAGGALLLKAKRRRALSRPGDASNESQSLRRRV